MGRNRGRSHVPDVVVDFLVSTSTARLASRHPTIDPTLVTAIVYQAAIELVSTATDPADLLRQLDQRADARLLAQAGVLVPVTVTREPALPGPRPA